MWTFKGITPHTVALEISSSKICCWVARQDAEGGPCIVGKGEGKTYGLWGGKFLDVRGFERALSAVICEAEQTSGIQIRHATVALGLGHFVDSVCEVSAPLRQESVSAADFTALVGEKLREAVPYTIVHAVPLEFGVDGTWGLMDPLYHAGKMLQGRFYALGIPPYALKTLMGSLKRCRITPSALLFNGYSAALACLSPEELELGVTLVDIGACGMTLSCFFQERLRAVRHIPLGGRSITEDIAQGCQATLASAERIKTLYGAALYTPSGRHDMVRFVPLGGSEDDPEGRLMRTFLVEVIQARAQEMIDHLRESLRAWRDIAPVATQRLVITGGGAQLTSFVELMQRQMNENLRLGRPMKLAESHSCANDAATIIGTVMYPHAAHRLGLWNPLRRRVPYSGLWDRILSWF